MKCNWTVIPDINDIDKFISLCNEYDAAFEYNDFFDPQVYEDEKETERRIDFYMNLDRDRSKDTLHGVFYDIAALSNDSKIRAYSRDLMDKSMKTAERLGCMGVVFHTSLIAGLNSDSYVNGWISGMSAYIVELADKYPGLDIYMENTFERYPEVFLRFMEKIGGRKNIKLCLDYSHATLIDNRPDEWFKAFLPYLGHMHLNDNDLKADLHLAAGDGKMDFLLFKELMEKNHVDVRVLLEVNGIDKAKRSLEYMASL